MTRHASAGHPPATSNLYLPTLDGLRFCAFLLVFIHHLPDPQIPLLSTLHYNGWVGVHLFLLLSAFLLTSILRTENEMNGRISVYNFYVRRGLRIWPLYFAFCFAMLALQFVRQADAIDWYRFFPLIFFFDNVVTGFQGYNGLPYAAHLWTISLEEQFYLVLPIILAVFLKNPGQLIQILIAIWLLFVGLRILSVLFQAEHPLIWTSVFSADALLLGTALGAVRWQVGFHQSGYLAIFAVGCMLLFSSVFLGPIQALGWHQVLVYTTVALGAAMIVIPCVYCSVFYFLGMRWPAYFGKLSYGLYIFHLLGIAIGGKLTAAVGHTSWWSLALLSLLSTMVIAVISYELFERVFLRLKRRFEAVHSRAV